LGMKITYPAAAKVCAFQFVNHESIKADCGPPWISIIAG